MKNILIKIGIGNGGITQNPNLTIEIIEKYPNKQWFWYYISINPNLTIGMINIFPNENWKYILKNPFKKDYEIELNKYIYLLNP